MGELRYDGKVAVVTGAGQGLGREYALLLASRGARVLVNDFAREPGTPLADRVVHEIISNGGEAAANYESVATEAGGTAIIEAALNSFGAADIVINNAGIVRDRTFRKLSSDDIVQVLRTHLGGAFWVTRAAWGAMIERNYGRLIFTTSLSGLIGNFGQANYGAAKTAVIGLARVLAAEGDRYGIKSNVIAPLAQTEMATKLTAFDVSQFSAGQVAAVVGYLAHESCSVNGEIFSAIGGRVARYFIGLTQGIYDANLSPESVMREIDRICDPATYTEPRTLAEEINGVLTVLDRQPRR